MKIIIKGIENGKSKTITYVLFDVFDLKTNTSSMARTTGYTATAAAELILNGGFNLKGVFPPELIGNNTQCFNHFLKYLEERNVKYHMSDKIVE